MRKIILALTTLAMLTSCKKTASTESTEEVDTVKVGVLHSLTGTMAISETDCKNATLLAIEEINAAGGILGKKIAPIVEDGASDWPTFTEKATKLIDQDNVKAVFGCWTSSSRKAVLPVFESKNNLLFYPVQYEGMEASKNVVYTGAAPNQQILPAVDYLIREGKKKFFLVGSDYVFPRTANKIIKAKLKLEGYEIVGEEYAPLGHTDFTSIVQKIKSSGADAVLNTINGDSNIGFFKQMKSNGLVAPAITCMSFSIAEVELKGIGVNIMKGQLTAWNYFMSMKGKANEKFIKAYKAKYGDDKVTDDPIEAAYFGVYLWAEAVKKASSFEPAAVQKAIGGVSFDAPEGTVSIDPVTNHTIKNFMVGRANDKGQFDIMYQSPEMIKADPFPSIATDKRVIAPGNIL
ncbi:urea ABC transporter substrate-binding protein [Flavobacterium sp. ALD4]|uniref:urea ABC transporter substrate-binding protein n=1 Tax=Flavobacterium sp. ALD4 TaxID=2058314 RepID=UPI000C3412D8|nr:urea ABC transporter substrate-binding protein [Flavobacterium sp. ALD4]PKH66950.1 urea ABC transporter substrate-binding protein [Flavobacterium sp. ALD4]